MKIIIELEGTGAEARQQLLDLLGQTDGPYEILQEKPKLEIVKDEAINTQENPEKISEKEKNFGVTKETRTRRTKAQIEAEAKAAENKVDLEEETIPESEEIPAAEAATSTVKIEDLQKKAVELGRAGKRDACKTVLVKYGAESLTKDKPLAPEHFEAVLAEFEKL